MLGLLFLEYFSAIMRLQAPTNDYASVLISFVVSSSHWTATSSMAVQEGYGTHVRAMSPWTEEEASTLTHRPFQYSYLLAVFSCLTDMVLLCVDSLQA